MRAAVAFAFSFVVSTLAYQILSPNSMVGWTNMGPQNVSWTRVDTDPSNFTALLTNQVISGYQPQVLAALVDGTTGFTQLSSQNGGFTLGLGFRLNFVLNTEQLDTILAQSNQFNITEASSSSSPTGTTESTAIVATSPTSQTGITGPGSVTGITGSSAGTSASIIPTSSSSAASSYSVQTGLLVLFPFLGFALA